VRTSLIQLKMNKCKYSVRNKLLLEPRQYIPYFKEAKRIVIFKSPTEYWKKDGSFPQFIYQWSELAQSSFRLIIPHRAPAVLSPS
jgi:hypothetical protein